MNLVYIYPNMDEKLKAYLASRGIKPSSEDYAGADYHVPITTLMGVLSLNFDVCFVSYPDWRFYQSDSTYREQAEKILKRFAS